jgi:hypothetical protein
MTPTSDPYPPSRSVLPANRENGFSHTTPHIDGTTSKPRHPQSRVPCAPLRPSHRTPDRMNPALIDYPHHRHGHSPYHRPRTTHGLINMAPRVLYRRNPTALRRPSRRAGRRQAPLAKMRPASSNPLTAHAVRTASWTRQASAGGSHRPAETSKRRRPKCRKASQASSVSRSASARRPALSSLSRSHGLAYWRSSRHVCPPRVLQRG